MSQFWAQTLLNVTFGAGNTAWWNTNNCKQIDLVIFAAMQTLEFLIFLQVNFCRN
jgi:hypothetical protein